MTYARTLLTASSMVALLAAPAAALTMDGSAMTRGTDMGDTIGFTYSDSGTTGTIGAAAEVKGTDRGDTLLGTEASTEGTTGNTFKDSKPVVADADNSDTLGMDGFDGQLMADSDFVGDAVVTSDDVTIGSIDQVWEAEDGTQYLVVAVDQSADQTAQRFLLAADGEMASDGTINLMLTQAEVDAQLASKM